jgi:hypothetical protein
MQCECGSYFKWDEGQIKDKTKQIVYVCPLCGKRWTPKLMQEYMRDKKIFDIMPEEQD